LGEVFRRVPLDNIEAALDALESHQRIFVLGMGREGLGSKAFAMRLTHFGKTVHWGWDDTTPAVTPDDPFIMPTGPANIPHLHYIAEKVEETGATLLVATADPDGQTAQIPPSPPPTKPRDPFVNTRIAGLHTWAEAPGCEQSVNKLLDPAFRDGLRARRVTCAAPSLEASP